MQGQMGNPSMSQMGNPSMGQMGNPSQNESLILFYHEDSNACKKLMPLIPKDKKIQYVNVGKTNNIPKNITSIPALLINNEKLLMAKKVFDYFNEKDEIEFYDFNNNSSFGFSNIDDNDTSDFSNDKFSSLEYPSISQGLPEYKENSDKSTIDIESLQSDRDKLLSNFAQQNQNTGGMNQGEMNPGRMNPSGIMR
jgi:hypothetical protein